MARNTLVTLLFLMFPLAAFAQNDVGVWLNTNQFSTTTITDPAGPSNPTLKVKFDQKLGYGITLNHFSGPNVSTEFGLQQLRADAKASVHIVNPPVDERVKLGSFKVNAVSALLKWHFMPQAFIVPYIGAGAVYLTGGQIKTVNDPAAGTSGETVKFGNKFNYVIDAGVNFAVTRSILIGLDVRHSPYTAREKGSTSSDNVKIDPTTMSLGVRFRM